MTTPYVKTEVKLPRLAGASLRALATALDVPGLSAAIQSSMMKSLGIEMLRQRATDAPQWTPTRLRPRAAATTAPTIDLEVIAGAAGESGIAAFTGAYRGKKVTPVDVAEKVIAQTAASNALPAANGAFPLRAIVQQDVDDVRAQAKASAERWSKGAPLSVLDGVPVAIKDEVDQKGYGTSAGTKFFGKEKATEDSFAVSKLRAMGAMLIGKANMHELGMGVTGLNPHLGSARNPHDLTRATGGSSSGSGAAIAAGLVPLALGADGGGSIRTPSSLCGVVGLKPTFGRVSEHGAAPICWTVAHIGPMGATARDVAVGMAVMGGPDKREPQTELQPPLTLPTLDGDLKGRTLGVFKPWFEDATPDVVSACWAGMKAMEKRGATIVDVEVPDLDLLRVVHLFTIVIEMAASQAAHYDAHKGDYGVDTRINLKLARSLDATDYVHAQRHRSTLCDHFDRALEKVDALCTPTVGCVAPPLHDDALATGESDLPLLMQIMRFAPAANITGLPAISIPSGTGAHGMPVGLMAMGRAFEEGTLLHLADALGRDMPPPRAKHRFDTL